MLFSAALVIGGTVRGFGQSQAPRIAKQLRASSTLTMMALQLGVRDESSELSRTTPPALSVSMNSWMGRTKRRS
jgi:hypothetical protein